MGPDHDDVMNARREVLRANLALVRDRIERAAVAAGREPESITLTAVTKTYPASDIALLAELGVTDVGESRVQEASAKYAAVGSTNLIWHLIGQLQRNKVNAAVRCSNLIESLDRESLVPALARAAESADKVQDVLIQVDLDEVERLDRGGVRPDDVATLADLVAGAPSLRLRGVMAVAPLGADPNAAFERLARVHEALLAQHPMATIRSAGMSGDLEQAVAYGATHVRIGTALLGSRPVVGYGA